MTTAKRLGLTLGLTMLAGASGCASALPVASLAANVGGTSGQAGQAGGAALMSILKAQPDLDAKKVAADLATRLGLQGDVLQDPGTVGVNAGSDSVLVHTDTGIAEYNTPYKWGGVSTGSAPDLETCKGAALQFLLKLAIAPQDELTFYQAGESDVSYSTGGGRLAERQIVYDRLWEGRLIQGPGSQLTVFVGEGARIDGAFLDWPTLTEIKQVPVKDADQARAQLSATIEHTNELQGLKAAASDFQLTQSTLGYMAFMNPDGSRDILPAYAYAGTYPASQDTTRLYFVAASDDYPLRDPASPAASTGSVVPMPGPSLSPSP